MSNYIQSLRQQINGSKNVSKNTNNPQGIGPNAAGIIGGTLGQAAGTPFDLLTGPGGTMAGGALGGGLAGGGENLIEQLLSGQGIDFGKLGQATSTQAAYGAIPGFDEVRALPLAARLATRGGVGAVGNTIAQGVQNATSGQPITKDLTSAAVTGAGSGIVAPAITKVLSSPFKLAAKLGGAATSKLVDMAQQNLAKAHFGLLAAEHPEVAALADKNPVVSRGNVRDEALKTSDTLNGVLDQFSGNINDFKQRLIDSVKSVPPTARGSLGKAQDFVGEVSNYLDQIIKDTKNNQVAGPGGNVATDYGTGETGNSRYHVFNQLPAAGGTTDNTIQDLPLSVFNQIKANIGKNYETSPESQAMWHAAKNYMVDKMGGEGNISPQTQKLWTKQEALIHANNKVEGLMKASSAPKNLMPSLQDLGSAAPLLIGALSGHPVLGGAITTAAQLAQHPDMLQGMGNMANNVGPIAEKGVLNFLNQLGLRSNKIL